MAMPMPPVKDVDDEVSTASESGDDESDENWWEREYDEYHDAAKNRGQNATVVSHDDSSNVEKVNEDISSYRSSTLDAWAVEPNANAERVPTREAHLAGLSDSGSENQDERGHGFAPTAPEEYSYEQVIMTVNALLQDVGVLSQVPFLSEKIQTQISVAQVELERLGEMLQRDEPAEAETDVEALLGMNTLPWDFDNEEVDAYRARASRFPHADFLQTNLDAPRYFSGGILPRNSAEQLRCNVRLPPEGNQVQITITGHDTGVTIIGKVYDMYPSRAAAHSALGDPSQYILKVVGLEEYMYGSEILYNYETVRGCLRNLHDLELSLVRRPTPSDTVAQQIFEGAERYKIKVNPTVPVLMPDDFIAVDQYVDILERNFLPMRSIKSSFRMRIRGVEHVTKQALPRLDANVTHLRIEAFLFHGLEVLKGWGGATTEAPRSQCPRWHRWLGGADSLKIGDLPRETRACFVLMGKRITQKEEDVLAWVSIPIIDPFGKFRSGTLHLNMWPIATNIKPQLLENLAFVFRGSARENLSIDPHNATAAKAILTVDLDTYLVPVAQAISEQYEEPNERRVGGKISWKKLPKNMRARLDTLIKMDPLYQLTEEDKQILWATRHHLQPYPLALPKFLQSVDWASSAHKNEAHRLLSNWTPPLNPVSALELLDAQYADYKVREYAVNCLRVLPDDELQLFLLQLTQSVKHEPYHDSPLIRFLIERALQNPHSIGLGLFWHLKAELHNLEHCERYAVVLEEYLHQCGHHAAELRKQYALVQKLQRISGDVAAAKRAKLKTDDTIKKDYHNALHNLNSTFLSQVGTVQIPLNPKWVVTTLRVEKCGYMSSKMAPLWLVFNNADPTGDTIIVMFKSGDDLRQDILTLQLLRVMDKIWVSEDLDMRLSPYTCVATGVNAAGKGVGMIEVVRNSDTTSGIQVKYGGGALGALKMEPLQLFISDHNKEQEQYERAKDNFMRSCAGYCVATYVLGIGDRHNGNIMLTEDGHLFHIDFGHFLGNFKSKLGWKRERAAFVLTPEMAFVMGGRRYRKSKVFKTFTELSAEAFTILRNHASLFINLFSLMVSAQMPELMQEKDIFYLRDKFFLSDTEKGAVARLRKEIDKSLKTTYRTIDNFIHNLKHG